MMSRTITIALFCVSLLWIGLTPVFESSETRVERARVERRALSDFPGLSLRSLIEFPTRFDAWANDNFGFRGALISLHAFINNKIFGDLPSTRYIRGKDGWFFRGKSKRRGATGDDESYNDILDIAGRSPFSEKDLNKWRDRLNHRRRMIEQRGGTYIFGVGPRKSTIYPEYLPDLLSLSSGTTRLDQFLSSVLPTHPDAIVNLKEALLSAKKNHSYGRLYYRTDAHWNFYGAYFAYEAFMRRAATLLNRQELQPIPLSLFEIRERQNWQHRGFKAETRSEEKEEFPILFPKAGSPYSQVYVTKAESGFVEAGDEEASSGSRVALPEVGVGAADMPMHKIRFLVEVKSKGCSYIANEAPNLPLKDLILIGDSFLQMAAPYFSAHASNTYLCRQTTGLFLPIFDEHRGVEISTDLVIQELTEAYLGKD